MKIAIHFFFSFSAIILCSSFINAQSNTNTTDIISIIQTGENFTQVASLLSFAGPISANNSQFYSAFVPVDGDEDLLPSSSLDYVTANPRLARKFLGYGVVPQSFNLTQNNTSNSTSSNNETTPTIVFTASTLDNSSGPIYITLRNGTYYLNNYIEIDIDEAILADNGSGIVYPTRNFSLPDFTFSDFLTLYNASLFRTAITIADLEDEVDQSNRTFFVPSNEAILRFLQDNNLTVANITDSDAVEELLEAHFVSGTYSFLNFTNDKVLRTIEGFTIRLNVYQNNTFTVNGHVVRNGGWIKNGSLSSFNGSSVPSFNQSLTSGNTRRGFFYPIDEVLVPARYNAYQYIGLISNYTLSLSQNDTEILSREAITVFYANSSSTGNDTIIYVVNGTYFAPGLFSGDYVNIFTPSGSNSTNSTNVLSVMNDGEIIRIGAYRVERSVLVTNGVVHLLSPDEDNSNPSSSTSSLSSGIVIPSSSNLAPIPSSAS